MKRNSRRWGNLLGRGGSRTAPTARKFVAGIAAIAISGCSLLGEPSNTPPNAALSKANLTAACEATSATPAQQASQKAATDAWLACMALSQVTLFCQNVRSDDPIDTELIDVILAFAPDPILSTLGNDALDVANAAAGQWCTTQGY
jgi:hypothetical protein